MPTWINFILQKQWLMMFQALMTHMAYEINIGSTVAWQFILTLQSLCKWEQVCCVTPCNDFIIPV